MTLTPSKVRKLPIQEPELLTYPELFHHQEDDTLDLLELLQTVWNWKWLILLLVVLGTLGSYGVTSILPKVYSASVLFLTEDENGYVIDNCSSRMLNFSRTTEKHPEV